MKNTVRERGDYPAYGDEKNGRAFTCLTEEKSLLPDMKALLKEFYIATFMEEENALFLQFNNGQRFKITIKEIK